MDTIQCLTYTCFQSYFSRKTSLVGSTILLCGIYHCVTAVCKWVFDSTFCFAPPLTQDDMGKSCMNDNEVKIGNVYKWLLKAIRFKPTENNTCLL